MLSQHMQKAYFIPPPLAILLGTFAAQADSISVNFGSNETNGLINNGSIVTAGAIPVPGTGWNNAATPNGSATNLIDDSGSATTADVTWATNNTWRSGSGGGTGTSQNGNLLKGYLDDSPMTVTTSEIPYLFYDLYLFNASDSTGTSQTSTYNAHPFQVNGDWWHYGGSDTILQDATWEANGWTNADTLAEGSHYLKLDNYASSSLTITSRDANGSGRGSLAGIQVNNLYTGTLSYWDINGVTAGAGGATPSGTWDGAATNWSSSSAGDVATGAWTSGNGAVFSAGADATGVYAVTVSGAKTASALWFKDGAATLSGDGVTLSDQAVVRVDDGLTAQVDSVISGTAGLHKVGNGALVLGTVKNYTGDTVISGGTVTLGGPDHMQPINVNSEITINHGATLNVSSGINAIQRNGSHATIIVDGGTLDYTAPGHGHIGNITLKNGGTWSATTGGGYNGENMQLNGTVTVEGTSASTIETFNEGLALVNSNTFNVGDVTGDTGVDLTVNAELEDNDGGVGDGFTKTGAGTMRLAGSAKIFSGSIDVNEGTLRVNATLLNTAGINVATAGTLELGATNIFVTGHGGVLTDTRVLDVNGGTMVMTNAFDARFGNVNLSNGATWTSNRALTAWDALIGQTSAGAAVVDVSGTGESTMDGTGGIHMNHTVTFNVDSTASLNVSMQLDDGGNTGGAGGITKTGDGELIISSTTTSYTGPTNVNAGELSVTGSLGATAVTVADGATLSGNGTLGGDLNFAALSKLDVTDGILTVNGNVTFDGFGFDDLIGFDPETAAQGVYDIILGNNVDLTNVAHVGPANARSLSNGGTAYFQQGSLQVVVIPEPSSALLLMLSGLAIFRRRR